MLSILAFKNFIIGPKYLCYKLSAFFIGGSLISTTFLGGVKVGLISFIPLLINNFILTKLFVGCGSPQKDNTRSLYALLNKPFGVAVCAPIIEEVLFRGVLLNMMIIEK
jgi:membrane protease YdiL (CAAX protease family)